VRPRDAFDAAYYRRHYTGPARVHSARDVARLASGVLGVAAWLGVRVRTVLDVGAGPGHWGRFFRRRGAVRYRGVDVSEHACERWGHERRDISTWCGRERFDLVVCQSVLQYLDDRAAARAIDHLGRMCRGLLYLEAITRRDLAATVDVRRTDMWVYARDGEWYRRRLARHFVQVGAGLWASRRSGVVLYELEGPSRPPAQGKRASGSGAPSGTGVLATFRTIARSE